MKTPQTSNAASQESPIEIAKRCLGLDEVLAKHASYGIDFAIGKVQFARECSPRYAPSSPKAPRHLRELGAPDRKDLLDLANRFDRDAEAAGKLSPQAKHILEHVVYPWALNANDAREQWRDWAKQFRSELESTASRSKRRDLGPKCLTVRLAASIWHNHAGKALIKTSNEFKVLLDALWVASGGNLGENWRAAIDANSLDL